MANWAIVVGINDYATPELRLGGAVRDGLAVCSWLLNPLGGNVPPRNLFVLMSPAPALADRRITIKNPSGNRVSVDWTIDVYDATKGKLVEVLLDVARRSAASSDACDRLYFHFSGHGIMCRQDISGPQGGILLSDFTDTLTDSSISVQELKDFFAATRFADQFFFLDGCRNVPVRAEFRLGRFPRYPDPRQPEWPTVQQFFMFATAPGLKAAELAAGAGVDERGAFTTVLLRGLAGQGTAKLFDDLQEQPSFVVRWGRLFEYVQRAVGRLPLPFVQVPQQDGARGAPGRTSDPELARHAVAAFPPEPLTLDIDPKLAARVAEVSVFESGERNPLKVISRPTTIPLDVALAPRPYAVEASATGFRPRRKRWPVQLYEPTTVLIGLDQTATASRATGGGAPDGPDTPNPTTDMGDQRPDTDFAGGVRDAAALEELNVVPFVGPVSETSLEIENVSSFSDASDMAADLLEIPADGAPATLNIEAPDPLMRIQVLDHAGREACAGDGEVVATTLRSGSYLIRTQTPEGLSGELLVDLTSGQKETIVPPMPRRDDSPTMNNLVERTHFSLRPTDGTLEVAKRVGPIAAAELSTVLTLAGAIATFGGDKMTWGRRLRGIGLPQPVSAEAASGVYVLFGDEPPPGHPAMPWPLIEVTIEPGDQAERAWSGHPHVAENAPFAAWFAATLSPGSFYLRVSAPDRSPIVFPLIAFDGLLTMMVFARRQNGDIHVFQHLPELRATAEFDPQQVRYLELVQRYILRGQYSCIENPNQLADLTWSKPLSACLAAYLALRGGDRATASRLAERLAHQYPKLADAHVILASCVADEHASRAHLHAALHAGVPMFTGGLALLRDSLHRLHTALPPDSPFTLALGHRVPGLIWTAYEAAPAATIVQPRIPLHPPAAGT